MSLLIMGCILMGISLVSVSWYDHDGISNSLSLFFPWVTLQTKWINSFKKLARVFIKRPIINEKPLRTGSFVDFRYKQ